MWITKTAGVRFADDDDPRSVVPNVAELLAVGAADGDGAELTAEPGDRFGVGLDPPQALTAMDATTATTAATGAPR